MIQNIVIDDPIELFELHERVKLDDSLSKPLLIHKTGDNFYCPVITDYTNVGFRWAYFLWIMRGANIVEQLDYYSEHMHFNTDDDLSLRGAFGPRLRFWVGADQIVEANRTNTDIEDIEDIVKPKGVDQLYKVYQDLRSGMEISAAVIFDPSIDFEDSNDIPNLISLIFRHEDGLLNIRANFTESMINAHFVNDYFFLSILQHCMASWLESQCGELTVYVENPVYVPQNNVQICKIDRFNKFNLQAVDFSIEEADDFWRDLDHLFFFERHMRLRLLEETSNLEDVSILWLCEQLKKKYISKIKGLYWVRVAHILMIYSLVKNCKLNDDIIKFCCELLESEPGCQYYELAHWISMKFEDSNDLTNLCERMLADA